MDNLIIATRRKGKTSILIDKCNKDKYSLIVCPNRAICEYTFKMAQDLGKPIPMPITFEEFVNHKWHGKYMDNFYFDELQMSLEQIAKGVNISDVVIDVSHSIVKKIIS